MEVKTWKCENDRAKLELLKKEETDRKLRANDAERACLC
jgi:hypothetical protein